MKTYNGPNFATVYKDLLNDLLNNPDNEVSSRNLKFKEISPVVLNIDSLKYALYNNAKRSSKEEYIRKELFWYWSGSNKADDISPYAKMWDSIKNTDGTVNSAYGYRVLVKKNSSGQTQMDWVIDKLKSDIGSRQAYLLFTEPDLQYKNNKDLLCTMYVNFQIRNMKLNTIVHMRSNDVIYGLPNDVPFFSTLQQYVMLSLRNIYPSLSYGSYTHIVDSMHLYDHHYEVVADMLNYNFYPSALPAMRFPKEWDTLRQGDPLNFYNDYLLNYILHGTNKPLH